MKCLPNLRHRRLPPVDRFLLAVVLAVAGLGLMALAGCLEEPEIDERWTLLEVTSSQPQPGQTVTPGQTLAVSLAGRVTYRAIRTGFLVAELRYSDVLEPQSVALDPSAHTLATAQEVERILDNSVTAGRATRAVTGFDHLVQTFALDFDATVPTAMAGSDTSAAGGRGLFMLLYLAEGDEIELAGGRDSLVVTPLPVAENELLFTGFPLEVNTTGPGGTP